MIEQINKQIKMIYLYVVNNDNYTATTYNLDAKEIKDLKILDINQNLALYEDKNVYTNFSANYFEIEIDVSNKEQDYIKNLIKDTKRIYGIDIDYIDYKTDRINFCESISLINKKRVIKTKLKNGTLKIIIKAIQKDTKTGYKKLT